MLTKDRADLTTNPKNMDIVKVEAHLERLDPSAGDGTPIAIVDIGGLPRMVELTPMWPMIQLRLFDMGHKDLNLPSYMLGECFELVLKHKPVKLAVLGCLGGFDTSRHWYPTIDTTLTDWIDKVSKDMDLMLKE